MFIADISVGSTVNQINYDYLMSHQKVKPLIDQLMETEAGKESIDLACDLLDAGLAIENLVDDFIELLTMYSFPTVPPASNRVQ